LKGQDGTTQARAVPSTSRSPLLACNSRSRFFASPPRLLSCRRVTAIYLHWRTAHAPWLRCGMPRLLYSLPTHTTHYGRNSALLQHNLRRRALLRRRLCRWVAGTPPALLSGSISSAASLSANTSTFLFAATWAHLHHPAYAPRGALATVPLTPHRQVDMPHYTSPNDKRADDGAGCLAGRTPHTRYTTRRAPAGMLACVVNARPPRTRTRYAQLPLNTVRARAPIGGYLAFTMDAALCMATPAARHAVPATCFRTGRHLPYMATVLLYSWTHRTRIPRTRATSMPFPHLPHPPFSVYHCNRTFCGTHWAGTIHHTQCLSKYSNCLHCLDTANTRCRVPSCPHHGTPPPRPPSVPCSLHRLNATGHGLLLRDSSACSAPLSSLTTTAFSALGALSAAVSHLPRPSPSRVLCMVCSWDVARTGHCLCRAAPPSKLTITSFIATKHDLITRATAVSYTATLLSVHNDNGTIYRLRSSPLSPHKQQAPGHRVLFLKDACSNGVCSRAPRLRALQTTHDLHLNRQRI